jgi:uncharacterized membrane protein YjdF
MKPTSVWVDWAVLAAFTAGFLLRGNTEFLLYAVTLAILIAVVQRTHRTFDYPAVALWGFTVWLVMHMCGGFVRLAGVRLYDLTLLPIVPAPYHILRYDQFVHAACYFVITLLLGRVVTRRMNPQTGPALVRLLAVLAAMGVGAINEMIEFLAVAFLGAAQGVGDYTNNALDICCNGLGALCALPWVRRTQRAARGAED